MLKSIIEKVLGESAANFRMLSFVRLRPLPFPQYYLLNTLSYGHYYWLLFHSLLNVYLVLTEWTG